MYGKCLTTQVQINLQQLITELGLGNGMIVIHCCDSWSTMVMMIYSTYAYTIMIVADMIFEKKIVVYRTCFMQPTVWFAATF